MDKTERLILANQYKILSILKNNDNYKRYADILESGYSSEYWIFNDINDELNDDDQANIKNIVAMYESIHIRMNKFTNEQKNYILSLKKSVIEPLSDYNQNRYLKYCLEYNISPSVKDKIKYHNTTNPKNITSLSYYVKMINKWNSSYPNLSFDKICDILRTGDEPSFRSYMYAKKIKKIKRALRKNERKEKYRDI